MLSYEWADVGVTQIFYRHGEPDYLSAPFKGIRSGQTNATGIAQTFYLGNPDRRLSAGYTFDDEDPRASKTQIRQAVQELFKVKVTRVNTLNVHGKARRQRTAAAGRTPDWKKAIVTLQAGDKIVLT